MFPNILFHVHPAESNNLGSINKTIVQYDKDSGKMNCNLYI